MRNLNLLFNKTYYDTLTVRVAEDSVIASLPGAADRNDEIFKTRFFHEDYEPAGPMVSHSFIMEVCYPGLLIGIGNAHDSGVGDEEIGVGFSFDYVTGQPYIPGSTVKGVLRSQFKDHPEVIMALCRKNEDAVKKLEKEIFDNSDVFFDAVVYDGAAPHGLLMGPEFITPHKSPTENPVPIKILKILPGVRMEFRFRLSDGKEMCADEKKKLFLDLLHYFGVGAKTNVGFGILREANGDIAPNRMKRQKDDAGNVNQTVESQEGVKGAKCQNCGKWHFRYKKDSTEETWNWRKNQCKECGGRIR